MADQATCKYVANPGQKSDCGKPAKYMIGWERNGQVKWIDVCGTHDILIGVKNLQATGLTYRRAKELDRQIRDDGI